MIEYRERSTMLMTAGVTITCVDSLSGNYTASILLHGVRRQYTIHTNGDFRLANYINVHMGWGARVADKHEVVELYIDRTWYRVTLDEPDGI
ncbi:MAG: hypothetical protein WBP22_03155 [Candidatus Saccharimonas sp.]